MVEGEEIEFEEDLLRNYREVTGKLREQINMDHMQLIVDSFAKAETKIKAAFATSPAEISLPYSPFLLPQDRWDQPYHWYALPAKPNDRIVHLIAHFFLFRRFVNDYFKKFYDAEYPVFEQEYAKTFLATIERWKKGQDYQIRDRPLIPCQLECAEKKNKRAIIIEDQFCFVLGELNERGCRIVVNEPWKRMTLEISREEGTRVEATVGEAKGCERHRLVLADQVLSGAALVRLNDLRWECCQFELSFIAKFVKAAAEE